MTATLRLSDEFESPVVDPENPWPGLAAFGEAQADFFFGRQREVEDLFRRVRLNRLTVLYAQSGLGKTSLVRAALFPKLRAAGMLPVAIRLDFSAGAPPARAQIWLALAAALADAKLAAPKLGEDQTLWEYFHQRALEVRAIPVLVFDQFEELFTLGTERAGGAGFVRDCLNELASLIENRPPDRVEARFDREPKLVAQYDFDRQDYRVLLSLREDYLAHLHDLSERIPSITLNNMRLTALDGPRALEAVEKPGAARKLIAPGAADAIVRVVAGARDERPERSTSGLFDHTGEHDGRGAETPLEALVVDPSLLSLLCRELNHKRQEERLPAITSALVDANRQNILNNFYARGLAGLGDAVQIFVEEDLLTESGFRETLVKDSAEDKLRRRGGDPRALKVLENRRLLHFEQRGNLTRVELTHDVLAPVVRQSRSTRRDREALLQEEARKRRELEENERLAQQARAEAETKYERSKQQRRVFALFGVGMAAVAAVAVLKTIQATRATQRAEDASRTIVRQNTVLLDQTDRLNRQNVLMAAQQQALKDSTAAAQTERNRAEALRRTAEGALATAKQASTVSDSMVGIFCGSTLDLVNALWDSSSSNSRLLATSSSLLDKTDAAIGKMLSLKPADPCSRRLDTREKTVAAQVRRDQDNNNFALPERARDTASRARAFRALQALRALDRPEYQDSLSLRTAANSAINLTYLFFQLSDRDMKLQDSVLSAVRLGHRFMERIDPATDSNVVNQQGRLWHYATIILTRKQRYDAARSTLDTAIAAISRAKQRPNQNRDELEFTESQLWMRQAELDTAQRHPAGPALAKFDSAVVIARIRDTRMGRTGSQWWLAVAYESRGDLALALNQFDPALSSFDSAAATWSRRARRLRDTSDVIGDRQNIVTIRRKQARAALRLGRLGPALRYVRASVDSASAIRAYQRSFATDTLVDSTYVRGVRLFEVEGPRARADSAFTLWFHQDSVRVAAELASMPVNVTPGVIAIDHVIDGILNQLDRRFNADTVGKGPADKTRIRRAAELEIAQYRERAVWIHREIYRRTLSASARDTLATALGDLSWSYLLVGRPREAAGAASEAFGYAPERTYIIPNWFNAVLLSAPEAEMRVLFTRFAGQDVEQPRSIRFECAALRDLKVLRDLGSALPAQFDALKRLVSETAPNLQCPGDLSFQNPS